MRKIFSISLIILMVSFGSAFADSDIDYGNDAHVDVTATAAPVYVDYDFSPYGMAGGWADGMAGGWAGGKATTQSRAWGNKSAYAKAEAEGTAGNRHGSFLINTPSFKLGGVGSVSAVNVEGNGFAKGKDTEAYGPDGALVEISLHVDAFQQTGGYVGDGFNGFGGQQWSYAGGSANDADYSSSPDFTVWYPTFRGWRSYDVNLPAVARDRASATAIAAGGQLGGNFQTENSAAGFSIAANMACWNTDAPYNHRGNVEGYGEANFVATKAGQHGTFGQVMGTAAFYYEGYNRGAGVAAVGGKTTITNGANYTNVTSTSAGFATATSNGGGCNQCGGAEVR